MLLRWRIMVASLMTMNSIGASDDYVEVPTFLITNSATNESLQRSERRYNSRYQSLLDAVPGVPTIDYPVYSNVPLTGFNCYGKNFGGYYADPRSACQSFHVCDRSGGHFSFLCPNGTIFNQQIFACDWWFNSDCSRAESFYYLNENKAGALMAMATRLLPKAPSLPSQTSPEKRIGDLLLTAARLTMPSFHEGEPARPSSPRPRHLTSPVAIATPTPFPARHLPKPQPRPLIKKSAASEEAPIRADVRAFLEREANLKRPKVSSLRAKPTVSSLTFRWRNVA